MEFLLVLLALVLLDLAAARWGYDSRDLLRRDQGRDRLDNFDY
jgi:hypothetical protein